MNYLFFSRGRIPSKAEVPLERTAERHVIAMTYAIPKALKRGEKVLKFIRQGKI